MNRARFVANFAFAVAAAGLLGGCADTGVVGRVANRITTPDGGKTYVVATTKTSFYKYGPQQGNGADAELPKDTIVNLIRSSFGYAKVQVPSQGGQQGFVASEDIMPASPTLLAALSATPPPVTATSTSSASTRENFDVRSTDANFVPPPEALPDPDLPPATTGPSPQ